MGFAFGINSAVSTMFIAEIAPINMKGILISMVQIWINLGLLAPLSLNFLLPIFYRPQSEVPDYCGPIEGKHIIWREFHAVPILLALVQLFALLFIFKKENPIYLDHIRSISASESFESTVESNSDSNPGASIQYNIQQANQKMSTRLEKDTWSIFKKTNEMRKLIA